MYRLHWSKHVRQQYSAQATNNDVIVLCKKRSIRKQKLPCAPEENTAHSTADHHAGVQPSPNSQSSHFPNPILLSHALIVSSYSPITKPATMKTFAIIIMSLVNLLRSTGNLVGCAFSQMNARPKTSITTTMARSLPHLCRAIHLALNRLNSRPTDPLGLAFSSQS